MGQKGTVRALLARRMPLSECEAMQEACQTQGGNPVPTVPGSQTSQVHMAPVFPGTVREFRIAPRVMNVTRVP